MTTNTQNTPIVETFVTIATMDSVEPNTIPTPELTVAIANEMLLEDRELDTIGCITQTILTSE
jgi:hypothetical protein